MNWQFEPIIGYYTAETARCTATVAETFLGGWTWALRFLDSYGFYTDSALAGWRKFATIEEAQTACSNVYLQLEPRNSP